MARTTFPVEVLTPEGEVFSEEVEMLSTRTSVGSIGILAHHEPVLMMLEPTELRLYRSDEGGPAIKVLDCNSFLGVRGKSLETDLEGAARIGDRAYWIGSHGRKKNGKDAPNRRRFFATDISMNGGEPDISSCR